MNTISGCLVLVPPNSLHSLLKHLKTYSKNGLTEAKDASLIVGEGQLLLLNLITVCVNWSLSLYQLIASDFPLPSRRLDKRSRFHC